MLEITREHAKQILLDKQGLRTKNQAKSVIDVVKKIHNIQIDTISVVARSHELTIYNRFNNYIEKNVWSLIEEKKLFEYWSHAICLLPIEDFPFYAWKMVNFQQNPEAKWFQEWELKNRNVIDSVYNYIKKNGPTTSNEFKRENKARLWWDWSKEKTAMEYLFFIGKLMIAFRKNFQRYYDLTERILPASISHEPLSKEELPTNLVEKITSSLGIVSYEEIRNYLGTIFAKVLWGNNRNKIEDFLRQCAKEGLIEEIKVKDSDTPYFVLKNTLKQLEKSSLIYENKEQYSFLSPFDNLIRDRHLPLQIWDFDYKLEAYTPPSKREIGYYCLPILDRRNLIGKIDAKANRKKELLELKTIIFEPNYNIKELNLEVFSNALINFCNFHQCKQIKLEKVNPIPLKESINAYLH